MSSTFNQKIGEIATVYGELFSLKLSVEGDRRGVVTDNDVLHSVYYNKKGRGCQGVSLINHQQCLGHRSHRHQSSPSHPRGERGGQGPHSSRIGPCYRLSSCVYYTTKKEGCQGCGVCFLKVFFCPKPLSTQDLGLFCPGPK
jgi:hypothetical protein